MPRQTGPIKFTGAIGNVIGYKKGDEYFLRAKPAPQHLKKGKGYEHQRATMLEFGQAGKAGNLLYRAFADSSSLIKGANISAHLLREVLKVIKADKLNAPGQRNVSDGDTAMLEGFEFNEEAPLRKMLLAPYSATIDRKTGSMTVTIHELELKKIVKAPSHATHLMLQIAGTEVDFENHRYLPAVTNSIELPLHAPLAEQTTLTVQLPPKSQHLHFLALRVSFLQEFNGTRIPLKRTIHNAMAIVKVCSA